MMETLMGLVIWGFTFYALHNLLKALKELRELDQAENEEKLEELPPGTIAVFFEKIPEHETILCYSEDNRFLCQGKTIEEVQKNFQNRFPSLSAVIVDQDTKDFYHNELKKSK
jgi:hypothetical protein